MLRKAKCHESKIIIFFTSRFFFFTYSSATASSSKFQRFLCFPTDRQRRLFCA